MPGDSCVAAGEYTYKWSKKQTAQFIKMRAEKDYLFTGAKNSASVAWSTILEKMDLLGKVTPLQAKKKWENLKRKYKNCKCTVSGEGVSGKPNAATWPWFVLMDEVLGQRHSKTPPVLIASIPEDTPGPSSAAKDQDEEEPARAKRKRDRDDELIELIMEDIKFERETEERRAQESRERMNRLFSLLERLVEK
ncbi:uncharacterized protein [Pseudorasbora parva]